MIVAERKPISEIKEMLKRSKKVLIVGCDTCMRVCSAGGEKEVAILASALKMLCKLDDKNVEFRELMIERQCENEFIEQIDNSLEECDTILSMGCGAGVQAIAERFPKLHVFPALNTKFIGILEEQGIFTEKCDACGECLLAYFGGICPITRCSKSLLNGPCGGSKKGRCEINLDIECAWQKIYDKLKSIGNLEILEEIIPVKDWSKGRSGGPRKTISEEQRI